MDIVTFSIPQHLTPNRFVSVTFTLFDERSRIVEEAGPPFPVLYYDSLGSLLCFKYPV